VLIHVHVRRYSLRQESPADARVTRDSTVMAVSRHLGHYPTGNSAIRSADPENPCLETDMEWIECTVCEIIAFKLYCDLETGVRHYLIGRPRKPDPRLEFNFNGVVLKHVYSHSLLHQRQTIRYSMCTISVE